MSSNSLPDVAVTATETKNCDGCIRLVEVKKPESLSHNIGFNLTRSQWDPYPWVKTVDEQSAAGIAGLSEGDCLLRVNGEDLLGKKVSDVARLIRGSSDPIRLMVWSCDRFGEWDPEALVCGPLPDALRRLSAVVASILAALECPVCCGTVKPPAVACPRGHLVCAPCRTPLTACPLCRATYNQPLRNLLADEVYNSVVDAFDLHGDKAKGKLTETLFGNTKFIKSKEVGEFSAHDGGSKGLKWGTQRLLQRLLPARARSTGNIARAARSPTRSTIFDEERDLSRSLSNLEIAGCRQNNLNNFSNSLNSVSGCCSNVPPVNIVPPSNDEFGNASDFFQASINHENIQPDVYDQTENDNLGFYCPASPSCQERIQDDLHKHILQCHGIQLLLTTNKSVYLKESGQNTCKVVLHPNNHWFYPKFVRNERDDGVILWCWIQGTKLESSQYRLSVEVWTEENIEDINELITNEVELIRDDQPNEYLNKSRNPLLQLTSPVINLIDFSWDTVKNSKHAICLSDSLMKSKSYIKLTIEKYN